MVNLTIDNRAIAVDEATSILAAARMLGITIPTLCYLPNINEIGACRVCVVEVEGAERLQAACHTDVAEGMVVHTNSKRVHAARKANVELLLSNHNCNCTTCVRSGNCALQTVANDLNILDVPYESQVKRNAWDAASPLIRDASKCIQCMRCISVCDKVQSLGIWDLRGMGTRTTVDVAEGKTLDSVSCALCGQCITHCPVGALRERDDTDQLLQAIHNPNKVVLVQIAPAVRTAWGEGLGLSQEIATVGRMVAAAKELGIDYVFDTNFTADLTIMEEGSELLERVSHADLHVWPMFTSCCPGWLRFVSTQYPELLPNLSTAKSPQQMFGAVAKTYFAETMHIDPSNIVSVSVMPCLAKKDEASWPTMNDAGYGQDVDIVLTSREFARMLRSHHVNVPALQELPFDNPLGISTGAAVIFGATGGVMEAALRSAHFLATGTNPSPENYASVRGSEGWREVTVQINTLTVRAAIANGLGNARALIEAIRRGKAQYDFVEIMACPGGCVGGGGQPIVEGCEMACERAPMLYHLDSVANLRFSHENPAVQQAYRDFFTAPLSHKSHELLHTDHAANKPAHITHN